MDKSFDLLEERVRKAADLVSRLRKENKGFQEELGRLRSRLQEAERHVESFDKAKVHESEGLERDLAALRKEREEVRVRIGKLVEILEGVE